MTIATTAETFLGGIFCPNKNISKQANLILYFFWITFLLSLWQAWPGVTIIPKPFEISESLVNMIAMLDLLGELKTSFLLFIFASALSLLISLGLAYSSVMPIFRPLVTIVSKFRFMSLYGFTLAFLLMSMGQWTFKIELLTFGMSGYLITSYAEMVRSVKKKDLDYIRSLRMTEWQGVWHIIIQGNKDKVIELFRQNMAMIWLMLSMVEGYAMDTGGVGAMLFKQYRNMAFNNIFAVQMLIGMVGSCLDLFLVWFKNWSCPWSISTEDRR